MKKPFIGVMCALLLISVTLESWRPAEEKKSILNSSKPFTAHELFEKYISNIYESAHLQESGLTFTVFKKAITGFLNLKISNKLSQTSSILTVIDFTRSSTEKRMWIIDVINKDLVLNTWVAHGHGSGKEIASRFSDRMESHKSSIGFYLTDEVYYGKHGRSLRLDGMDAGFNTNARKREIVIHAADYVGQNVIEEQGRLGCSLGCPAVAPEVADQVIETIKDKTALFINGKVHHYYSKYLDEQLAANFVASDSNNNYIANL
jgi:hypothetical protein